ncbi:hypothetical protein GCM10009020_27150 [Natronoarchaeum mannanilyticum]|uniref:Uncharacterized protein n=1 Tax=Natronoarchaeum mannanilyticum TaxID=926360 RepID=A0AAV3TCH7_9EURY
MNNVTLDPCEIIKGTYALFASAGNGGCLIDGTYRVDENLSGPNGQVEASLSLSVSVDHG